MGSMGLLTAEQIKPTAHFSNDLGLDSLDTVEVVMAIEEVTRTTPYQVF